MSSFPRWGSRLWSCSSDRAAKSSIRWTRPAADSRWPTTAKADAGMIGANFAVAETGSFWLSEAQYKVNALGFLSQHLRND
jgi:L-lactate dehydrogenase complex protein LldG